MRGANACVPVRVWVYGASMGTGTAHVRFQSERYSIADVTMSTTEGWHSAIGHLRCGIGVEDDSVLMVLGRVSAIGTTLLVRALCVEYLTDV